MMKDSSEYFKKTYIDSRQEFIDLANLSKGELRSHKITTDLSFETLYFRPASGKKLRLLILTSGVHGIEGFTGSALQRYFIAKNFFNSKDEDLGILIMHGINAYGFQNERRVTEGNVDLNRNFDTTDELFHTQNPGYDKVYDFLNPKVPYSRFSFYASAIASMFKYGVNNLRRAILSGQYKFADGIFYGGKDFEPHVGLIQKEIMRLGEGYEKVLLVDLHTGYGEKGKLHLFGNNSPFIDQRFMDKVFKGLPVDYGEEKDFYAVTGGFTIFLAKLFHEKSEYAGICFEFGTINSQKLSGSLESLYRMINEKHEKDLFIEMFYPSDSKWRSSVVDQFENNLKIILQNFR